MSIHHKVILKNLQKLLKVTLKFFLPCDTKSDHDHYHENNRLKRKTEQNSQQFIPHSDTNNEVINDATLNMEKEEIKDRPPNYNYYNYIFYTNFFI